ncbi:MAG: phosphoenolpyruvate hydrolase family protein [Eubacteriales bacterium]|nr:phosphoenolpyruvate hydrolase family protein [Eubacteriales bacterium]
MDRETILRTLRAQIHINGHIIGAAVGSGMTAKYTAMGGADILLALSAGKYRIMGRSSYASYLCNQNSNDIVMDMGMRELLPIIKDTPVLFGLFASDPGISLYDYLKSIKSGGFSGIVNFPTIAMIDGQFREALEEEGTGYHLEVEAIKLAHYLDMFTLAFVTTEEEAKLMLDAGADVICVNLGLTQGGFLGGQKHTSLHEAMKKTTNIFSVCEKERPSVIKMIYAGPANTPIDMQYMYKNTDCQGYIGGSTFDRIPTERAIYNTTKAFKSYGNFGDPLSKMIQGESSGRDHSEYIKQYIQEHYKEDIQLSDLALVAHVSASYLSTKFKKENGVSFTEYLLRFRLNKAKEYLQDPNMYCKEVASEVGYEDYAQFSKMFKKHIGLSPTEYQKMNRKRNMEIIKE